MSLSDKLPAFPPRGFNPEKFLTMLAESEQQELSKVREVLKPHLKSIPREFKTVSQRVNYLINK